MHAQCLAPSLASVVSPQAMSQATFKKNDRIKPLTTLYDEGTGDVRDRIFSQRWADDDNGGYYYGRATRVFKKKSREPQKHKVRWDDASTSPALHEHLLDANCSISDFEPENGCCILLACYCGGLYGAEQAAL